MLTAIASLFTVFTSGAGGGIVGGLFAIFNKKQEAGERIELAKISASRDVADYANSEAERKHELLVLQKNADLGIKQAEVELQKVESESNTAMEVANLEALGKAQEGLNKLKTSTSLDNYRGSVRPTLAYWAAFLFTIMLIWAFARFGKAIEVEVGKQILIGMFATLTFIITSVISFYYVSRRNAPPKL